MNNRYMPMPSKQTPALIAASQYAACAFPRLLAPTSPRSMAASSDLAMKKAGIESKQPQVNHDKIDITSAHVVVSDEDW